MTHDKFLILTAQEIADLSALFNSGRTPLPSLGGKCLADVFGYNKTYNIDYCYSVAELDERLINNPDHESFGKYFVPVASADITEYQPNRVSELVDFDPTWRVDV